ncbi:Tar ligand binding domain-containing protein, partial [Aquabacterium sp.]|uniref:Tar ligand binding domain-containing protein n=1 Tax=Aquabacterium sp. TaxID=1872578 RepID=UPI002C1990EF
MNRLTIKTSLLLLVGVLIGFILLSVAATVVRVQAGNAQLGRMYNERVRPLMRLTDIADAYARGVVDTAQKARDGLLAPDAALKNLLAARQR